MFTKILIANRGEIAVRIMRTCREMGIATVAVYSEADRQAPHVRYADEAYCLGPAPALQSYLHAGEILAAASKSGAEAVHPGYGFLSENGGFARECRRAGLVFIGPEPAVIERMGNKTEARRLMQASGVPVIPGCPGALADYAEVEGICREIGLPVMIKAAAGGGGKGMRIAGRMSELASSVAAVQREAHTSFADSRLLVERYFPASRHIEVQILADNLGHTVHLFERECSIQRRYQKVVEECPSVFVDGELRRALTGAAVQAARAAGYSGAGTVEFLVDREKNFYFLEMNTRIQVEHSVTELVTGVDMVKEQIRVAAGLPLAVRQEDILQNGAALECRIYAEDPEADYLPCPGVLKRAVFPEGPGIRVDRSIGEGDTVTRHYDPMIAKISTWGRDREEARQRMLRALGECLVFGVKTNIGLHKRLLADPRFVRGTFDTRFLEHDFGPERDESVTRRDLAVIGAVCRRVLTGRPGRGEAVGRSDADPWRMAGKYRFWASRF